MCIRDSFFLFSFSFFFSYCSTFQCSHAVCSSSIFFLNSTYPFVDRYPFYPLVPSLFSHLSRDLHHHPALFFCLILIYGDICFFTHSPSFFQFSFSSLMFYLLLLSRLLFCMPDFHCIQTNWLDDRLAR